MDIFWVAFGTFAFPAFVVGMALGYAALKRYLKHKERMAMIEQGMLPPDWERERTETSPRSARTAGVMVLLVGTAITLGLSTIGFGPWLIGGLVPMAVGAGLLLSQSGRSEKGNGEKGD